MSKSIYAHLADIQKVLCVPKTQRNTHVGYDYRSCEDILVKLKEIIKDKPLAVFLNDEIVNVGGLNYIKATAVLVDTESGENVSACGWAREELEKKKSQDSCQQTGTASSYARKYALNGLFAIDNTKDPDNDIVWDREQAAINAEQESIKKELEPYIKAVEALKTKDEVTAYMKAHSDIPHFMELKESIRVYFNNLTK